jgi:hypothetical protein
VFVKQKPSIFNNERGGGVSMWCQCNPLQLLYGWGEAPDIKQDAIHILLPRVLSRGH